ncbi:MAG: UDP binding domain-containing protein [Pseudomonadota bacterium]|nr:UDP binding domain-containing protein [Pseudomonadota bacterium]
MNVYLYGGGLRAFVTSVCLAKIGHTVYFYEPNHNVSDLIADYQFEFSLIELFNYYLEQQQIHLIEELRSLDDSNAVHWLFFDEQFDPSFNSLAKDIINLSPRSHHHFILSSLAAIGTTDSFHQTVIEQSPLARVSTFCFPFIKVREGQSIHDFLHRDLLVVGCAESAKLPSTVKTLLEPIIQAAKTIFVTRNATAELARSTINGMLATRLSFMNEIAAIAEQRQVDIKEITQIISSDDRVGAQYLTAGCGFGGKTLPAELENLKANFDIGSEGATLISSVQCINESQKEVLFQKFWRYYNTDVYGKTVAIWGGAYKSGTGRTHNSPIHAILKAFWSQGIKTTVFDSQATQSLIELYASEPLFTAVSCPYDCLDQADALVITGWNSAEVPDFNQIKANLKKPVIFDGRNLFNSSEMQSLGIEYFGIGHGLTI